MLLLHLGWTTVTHYILGLDSFIPVKNAAAKLLTSTKNMTHQSYALRTSGCVTFKILLWAFKSLNGSAPFYLSDLLTEHQPGWSCGHQTRIVMNP